MALLADFEALGADQVTLGTLNGNVVAAKAALDTANAAVDAQNIAIGNDTTKVVTDLQTAPYTGSAAIVSADAASVQVLSVVPPANPGDPAGLAITTIPIAV